MVAPAHASLYKTRAAQWPALYAAVEAILGDTGTIFRVGDRAGGAVNATTFLTATRNTGLRAVVTTRVVTTATAPSAFATPLDPASEASWQGSVPVIKLDGVNERMDAPDAAYWTRALLPFSCGLWFKQAVVSASPFLICKFTNAAPAAQEFYFALNNDALNGKVLQNSTGNAIGRFASAITVLAGQWRHGVMTYSGGATSAAVKLYETGVQADATDDQSGTFVTSEDTAATLSIGARSTVATVESPFNGSIAGGPLGPFFTQKELTANEVAALYEMGVYALGL